MDYDAILTDDEPLEESNTLFEKQLPPWIDGDPEYENLNPDSLSTADIEKIISAAYQIIAGNQEDYVERTEQIGMTRQLLLALIENKPIVIEAGTGVGKSYAYLISSIAYSYLSGSRVLVSTETQNLQMQLMEKDLPWLSRTLDPSLTYSLCLGSGNYVCKLRTEEVGEQGRFRDLISESGWQKFQTWASKVFQSSKLEGNKFEVTQKLNHDFWSMVNRNPDSCPGQRCQYFQGCNYYRVRKNWSQNRILVANHHLYLFHLLNEKRTLPQLDAVVLDEAHGISKIGTRIFELVFHNDSVKDIQKTFDRYKNSVPDLGNEGAAELDQQWTRFHKLWDLFFQQYEVHCNLSFDEGTEMIEETAVSPGELPSICKEFILEWSKLKEDEENSTAIAYLKMLERWFQKANNFFSRFHAMDLEKDVFWAEKKRERFYLHCCRIRLGEDLEESKSELHVYTSATLGFWGKQKPPQKRSEILSSGYFQNFLQENSPYHENELSKGIYFSPFQYRQNALLYIPRDLEPPTFKAAFSDKIIYQENLQKEILRIINLSEGGTLVLFTSYSQLTQTHEFLKDNCSYPIFSQKLDGAVDALEQFKQTENGVLLGTSSYWQGVDIAGRALRSLIICKLMFTPPDDPVFKARSNQVEKMQKSSFHELALPYASTMLRQAFGRLIRKETDKGVVALLDSRVMSKTYGKILLQNLPPVDLVSDFTNLEERVIRMNLFSTEKIENEQK